MLSLNILALSIFVCVVIGVLVLNKRTLNTLTSVYLLLTLTLVAMSVVNYLAIESSDNQLWFVRLVMMTSTIAVFLIYLLVGTIASPRHRWNGMTWSLLIATAIVALLDVTDLVFPDVKAGNPPTPVVGPLAFAYFAHFFVTFGSTVALLWVMYTSTRDKRRVGQYRLLLVGIVPILILAPITSFVAPTYFGLTELVVITPLYALIFTGSVGYAIVRHGLFDVQQAAVRSVAYVLTLSALAAVYFLAAYLLSELLITPRADVSTSVGLMNVSLALLLAFLFQPIKRFFDKITDRIFFRNRYSTSEFIASFGALLASSSDLKPLLEAAAGKIADTLKTSEVAFVIYRDENDDEVFGATSGSILEKADLELLKTIFSDLSEVTVLHEMADDEQYTAHQRRAIRYLLKHQYSLVMPLGETTGYALLGEQQSGGYKHRDVTALEAVRDELFIAIQNARSLEEVRKFNKTLQHRINNATKELRASNTQLKKIDATKDEFISMASHQLRTPLTSIKGYVSMLLDGDAGELNPQQKKLLSEAFVSSERMVRLIGDFLNVSRLQTGKFIIDPKPVDLVEMVQEEVDSIERMAAQHDVRLSFKPPKHFPILQIDEDKTRQVIMNYIDNAVYYSRPKSTIVVKLRKDTTDVYLEVHDHGIGVPKDMQGQLFSKFFRADNARRKRPDGTGIGLYLAKRIITSQNGDVMFESTEGKGSMFGFRLPIKQPTARQ